MLERGLTNGLYGGEIADIMERFSDGPFQIQVWRDLAPTRYKLYDATGIWLQSKPYLTTPAYQQVESVAHDYLDESLVPAYFQRLRSIPTSRPPPLKVRQANYVTRAFAALPQQDPSGSAGCTNC